MRSARISFLLLYAAAAVAAASACFADAPEIRKGRKATFELADGTTVTGKVQDISDLFWIVDVGGGEMKTVFKSALKARESEAPPPVNVQSLDLNNEQDLQKWMSFYYQHRDTEHVVEVLKNMSAKGAGAKNKMTGTYFMSLVFARNGDRIDEWAARTADWSDSEKEKLWNVLFMAGTDRASRALLTQRSKGGQAAKETISRLLEKKPQDPRAGGVASEGVLRSFWIHFYATGDEQDVQRVIEATLQDHDPQLGTAAKRSLVVNGSEHALVMELLRRERNTQTNPSVKQTIDSIIKAAENRPKNATAKASGSPQPPG